LVTAFQSEFSDRQRLRHSRSLQTLSLLLPPQSTVSNVAWPPSRPRPRVLGRTHAALRYVSRIRHDAAKKSLSPCPLCPSAMHIPTIHPTSPIQFHTPTRPRAVPIRLGRPTRSPRHRRSQSYIVASSEDHETSACVLATYPVAASTSARAAAWSAPAGGRVAFVRCLLFTRSRALTSKAVVVPDLAWQMARCTVAHSLVHFN